MVSNFDCDFFNLLDNTCFKHAGSFVVGSPVFDLEVEGCTKSVSHQFK